MKRIRVAHIIDSMEVGGAQRQIVNLFHAIDRDRFDLRLICLETKGPLGRDLEREGFRVESLGKTPGLDIGLLFRLTRLLRGWQPDIVHTSVFTANAWGRVASLLAFVPVRISHEQSTVSLEKWHRRIVDRVLAWTTHRILTVSEDLRDRVVREEKISPRRVSPLPNAVDVHKIVSAADSMPVPDLPGVPGKRIGVVGRMEYRKDHLTLVRAAARVVEQVPDAAFSIVGDGPDRPKIEAEIRRLGLERNVHLLGERNDVPLLLHAFDLYVLSSITEGLSLSILEAMAAAVPVVATRVGGNSELLDEGRCGVLVSPGNSEEMAEAIVTTLNDHSQAARFAEAAHRRVCERYDLKPVARRLEEIYEQSIR